MKTQLTFLMAILLLLVSSGCVRASPQLELSKNSTQSVRWEIKNFQPNTDFPKVFVLAGKGHNPPQFAAQRFDDLVKEIENNADYIGKWAGLIEGAVTLSDVRRDIEWVQILYLTSSNQTVASGTHIPVTVSISSSQ